MVNGQEFDNLSDAVASVPSGKVEISLDDDADSSGLITQSGQDITINLNGHDLVITSPVGSPGTETLAFQFLKGSKVTIKNGILKAPEDKPNIKMLVQNYSDLVLDNVICEGNANIQYVVSNNFGSCTFKNGTTVNAVGNNVAFDVWYGMKADYDDGVAVEIADKSVVINGRYEYGKASRASQADFETKAFLYKPNGYVLSPLSGYEWVEESGKQRLVAVQQ